jgi:Fe-S cluster assembly scaffold protein SufB
MRAARYQICLIAVLLRACAGFTVSSSSSASRSAITPTTTLSVSVGLGPDQTEDQTEQGEDVEIVYEIPIHEDYRKSRLSKLDEACDDWLFRLLNDSPDGTLGSLAQQARERLTAQVPLVNDYEKNTTDEEWTPYVVTKLPWTPLVPSYGLEQFGLPSPRRNAEAWRHFDVPSMIAQDYSGQTAASLALDTLTESSWKSLQDDLNVKGAWLDDDACTARLVYINGHYCDALSKPTDHVYNLQDEAHISDPITKEYLSRLTDGHTDELVVPVLNGDSHLTSLQKLSGPNHHVGLPTSQFAINTQQGTACFAALNTIKTKAVAYIRAPAETQLTEAQLEVAAAPKPVLIVNAITPSAGAATTTSDNGCSLHPRTLIVADEFSRMSVVQSTVDVMMPPDVAPAEQHVPKLYNGYTQVFLGTGANLTHSYLEESGGMVTAGVELSDSDLDADTLRPREIEAKRPELADTHLEAIDVHLMGADSEYQGTVMSVGGSGRVRIALSVSLLHFGAKATVNGFSLSGGAQRTDMKTTIHHVAHGTTSQQTQKNMIGGRSTGAFRGRIRVEQSAQQTDSRQLSRTVLLSDRARAWAVPSLEIIADDVQCTHGMTVSDLSEEELFYLRSRGLGRSMARNLLMYAFAGDVASCVEPAMLGKIDSKESLQKRMIDRLENLVPQGDRAVQGEFQSI